MLANANFLTAYLQILRAVQAISTHTAITCSEPITSHAFIFQVLLVPH